MRADRQTGGEPGIFRLTPEAVRKGLQQPAPPPEENDLHMIALREGTRVTEAAVLVPLVNRPQGVQLLLTQRTAHLRDHAGQISFPGGRVEPIDPDREAIALRGHGGITARVISAGVIRVGDVVSYQPQSNPARAR